MDLSVVIALLGALGVGGWVTAFVSSWRHRRDKREERAAARDEAHRDQLRSSYSEFLTAYSKFLDAAELMYTINRAIDELPEDVYRDASEGGADHLTARAMADKAVSPELNERGRRALEDYTTGSSSATARAVAVLLIDDDVQRRESVRALADTQLIAPQRSDDYERFISDVRRLRARLHELTASIAGAFSPDRWHDEVAARRALPPAPQSRGRNVRILPASRDGIANNTRP